MATGLPDSTTIEIEFTDGVWTDVTSLVNVGAGAITRKVGRSTQLDTISAGSLSFTLDNPDGRFTPDNALSTYYPNVVEGKRVRWKVTEASTTYTRFTGWTTQWVPEINGASASVVSVNATDALGHLSPQQMWGLPETEMRSDSPVLYYTLDHPSDSYYVPFYSAVGGPSLNYRKSGKDGSLELSGGKGAPYDGLTCPKWVMASTSDWSPYLYTKNALSEDLYEWTIELAIQPNQSYSNNLGVLSYVPEVSVFIDIDGYVQVQAGGPALESGFSVFDGKQHLITIVSKKSGSGSKVSLYVDNLGETDYYTSSDLKPLSKGGTLVVGSAYRSSDYDFNNPATQRYLLNYSGEISHVAIYDKALSDSKIAAHNRAFDAYYGSTIFEATTAIANWTGVNITQESGYGFQKVDAIDPTDKKALDVLAFVSAGDGGVIYDDGDGLYARAGEKLKPPTVKLSLDVEADLDGSVTLTRSTTDDVAGATVSSYSQSATYVNREQAAAIGTFGTAEAPNLDQLELLAIASNIVAVSNNHRLTAGQASFDLANANSDKYADTLTLKIGDRVRLTNLMSEQFGRTYLDAYVQGWSESLNSQGYTFTFDLDAADVPSEAHFDDDTYGRFTASADGMILTSTITSSATSITVTTKGVSQPSLTTLAGSYPLDLDINGERVTVVSAPASSASPQTLTVTRGVAPSIARSHTAGEAVDVYMSGKFAL
jgi:hypothetical protein